jgi:hypothetical protein
VHRAGNALTDELGFEEHDLVLLSHFVHLFDGETNLALIKRVARATRPGGYVVIQEIVQPESTGEGGQTAAFLDLNFALGHGGRTWTFREMAAWQRAAGLTPRKPIRIRTGAAGLQAAQKPT